MAISIIQHATVVGGRNTSLTWSTTTTTGNLLVVAVIAEDSRTGVGVGSLTAPAGWAAATALQDSGTNAGSMRIFYLINATAQASTGNFNGNNNNDDLALFGVELSGCDTIAPLDQTNTGNGTSVTTTITSAATGTTTAANEIVIGGVSGNVAGSNFGLTLATSGSYILQDSNKTSDLIGGLVAQIVSATGTYAASWLANATGISFAAQTATFQATISNSFTANGDSTARAQAGMIATANGTSTASAMQPDSFSVLATSAASAIANVLIQALASANGTSTALGQGLMAGQAAANAAGSSTATAISGFIQKLSFSATGTSTATGRAGMIFTANGTSTAAAKSGSLAIAQGTSTATGATATTSKAIARTVGSSTMLGITGEIIQRQATANGTSTALGVGFSAPMGTINASSTALGISKTLVKALAAANASSTALGLARGIAATLGLVTGTSSATAQSGSLAVARGDSTAPGFSNSFTGVRGSASGTSTAQAIGASIVAGSGSGSGGTGGTGGDAFHCGVVPPWHRGYSTLSDILLATRDEFVAQNVVPANLCFITLTPEAQEPPQRSDSYVIITPGVQKSASHGDDTYTTGGGRELLVFDCDMLVTVYNRLDLDEHGAADAYLTDTLGVLNKMNEVMDVLSMFDPVDSDGYVAGQHGAYLLAEPMRVAPLIQRPVQTIKPGWGRIGIECTFSYQMKLCDVD